MKRKKYNRTPYPYERRETLSSKYNSRSLPPSYRRPAPNPSYYHISSPPPSYRRPAPNPSYYPSCAPPSSYRRPAPTPLYYHSRSPPPPYGRSIPHKSAKKKILKIAGFLIFISLGLIPVFTLLNPLFTGNNGNSLFLSISITSPSEGTIFASDQVTLSWNGSSSQSVINYYEVRIDSDSWINVGKSTSYVFSGVSDSIHTAVVRVWDEHTNSNISTVSFTVDSSKGRPMTQYEKDQGRGYFENLDVDSAIVTGEQTSAYNCISWSLGIVDSWIWPGSDVSDFDSLYQNNGYIESLDGELAISGNSLSDILHGFISGPSHGPRWESKCGSWLRFQHDFTELEGRDYGYVLKRYTKVRNIGVYLESIKNSTEVKDKLTLTKDDRGKLNSEINSIPEELVEKFESIFKKWKASWKNEDLIYFSNPIFVKISDFYNDLVQMGSSIIPLLIDKLTDRENFFALQLYDDLQSEKDLRVLIDTEDKRILEGEQGRAVRVVKRFLSKL